ncbi:MAG TPA: site-specific integrase [Pyrinomonadaceae bacterium]|jgi:integrase
MTVRKRGSRWWYDFRVRGVRHRGPIPEARTKEQAKTAEAIVRGDIYAGRYGRPLGTRRLDEFVRNVYLPWARQNKRSASFDEIRARNLTDYFRGQTLAEVSPLMIERYKRDRSENITHLGGRVSAGTINNELALLSRIFSMALDNGLVAFNPCSRVRRLRATNERMRYLTREEETRLFEHLPMSGPVRGIVEVALGTGMRRGEIISLSWAQVDFARGVLRVTNTKTGRDREVPMNSRVRTVLLAAQAHRVNELVFPGPRRRVISCCALRVPFLAACRAAGIVGLRFHDLRHTAATRMAEAGVSAFDIRDVLGHANIAMTQRYAHATPEGKRRAVEALAGKDGHKMVTIAGRRG